MNTERLNAELSNARAQNESLQKEKGKLEMKMQKLQKENMSLQHENNRKDEIIRSLKDKELDLLSILMDKCTSWTCWTHISIIFIVTLNV